MTKTTVVHCMKSKYDIYIGRPNPKIKAPSYKWGNPFRIGERYPTRDDAIEAYIDWFLYSTAARLALHSRLDELVGLRLGCWCWPRECHGNFLAYLADHPEERCFGR